jgi:hypothetical protein
LIAFFDLISFFAVASLFAWLGYGPLLSEEKASQGLGTLTDYFMFSFWFYAISAVSDYALHLPQLAEIYRLLAGIIVASAFILGTETLLVASYYVREFGKTRFRKTDIPPFRFVMEMTYNLTLGAISVAAGYLTSISLVGRTYFPLILIISWYGAYKYARSWRKPDAKAKRLMTIPIIIIFLWIIVSVVMFILFGWPI